MAENKAYFEDMGIKVSISSSEVIKVVNDNVALANFFSEYMPKQPLVHNALRMHYICNFGRLPKQGDWLQADQQVRSEQIYHAMDVHRAGGEYRRRHDDAGAMDLNAGSTTTSRKDNLLFIDAIKTNGESIMTTTISEISPLLGSKDDAAMYIFNRLIDNYEAITVAFVQHLGALAEVVSLYELQYAQALKFAPAATVYNCWKEQRSGTNPSGLDCM